MGVMDKLKDLVGLKGQDPPGLEAPSQDVSMQFNDGVDPVSFELQEQKEMFEAFYVHKMSAGQASIRDKDLDPALLEKAQQAAEIHMECMYPTHDQVVRDRQDLGELDAGLDHNLRDYGQEKRVIELEASQEAYGKADEIADAQKKAATVDPGYASLMRETGQMQQRIQDETGMTITFNENDLRQIHDFEDQCKDRIYEAVQGTNPSLGDIMAESAIRGKAQGSIEAAKERNMEIDREYAEEMGQQMEDIHMGAALQNRRQVQALQEAREGNEETLERDELQAATLSM